ncbi:hypothetical protein PVAP13_3KG382508, partial [Panicum virgatum]
DGSPPPPREPMLLQDPALFERLIPQLMEVPQLHLHAMEQSSRNLALPSMEELRGPHRCCPGHTRARRRFPCSRVHQLVPQIQRVMLAWTTPTICSTKFLQADGAAMPRAEWTLAAGLAL